MVILNSIDYKTADKINYIGMFVDKSTKINSRWMFEFSVIYFLYLKKFSK